MSENFEVAKTFGITFHGPNAYSHQNPRAVSEWAEAPALSVSLLWRDRTLTAIAPTEPG